MGMKQFWLQLFYPNVYVVCAFMIVDLFWFAILIFILVLSCVVLSCVVLSCYLSCLLRVLGLLLLIKFIISR